MPAQHETEAAALCLNPALVGSALQAGAVNPQSRFNRVPDVFRYRAPLKVLDAVVRLDPIEVIHLRKVRLAKKGTSHQPMNCSLLSSHAYEEVSIFVWLLLEDSRLLNPSNNPRTNELSNATEAAGLITWEAWYWLPAFSADSVHDWRSRAARATVPSSMKSGSSPHQRMFSGSPLTVSQFPLSKW